MSGFGQGRHLVLDGFGNPERLRNPEFVRTFLVDLVELAGMELVDLNVYDVEARVEDRRPGVFVDTGGVTGYAVLTTSHASIHTWPDRGEFRFDLYSCRSFDGSELEAFVLEALGGRAEQKINWVR
jgi:S-adenosylmethionine/arginine decarboxylase-like enzyme